MIFIRRSNLPAFGDTSVARQQRAERRIPNRSDDADPLACPSTARGIAWMRLI
jgi:hypothetical protein